MTFIGNEFSQFMSHVNRHRVVAGINIKGVVVGKLIFNCRN